MPSAEHHKVRFVLRQGPAGSHYLTIDGPASDLRVALGCDSVHLHIRDGVDASTLRSLADALNDQITTLSIQRS